ncbi:hypothetical protein HYT25_01085 [Candidatus Pacearchaeota archaeon]|nr:hypothetical protein [Candidatus Pacearchaeota archaeon]
MTDLVEIVKDTLLLISVFSISLGFLGVSIYAKRKSDDEQRKRDYYGFSREEAEKNGEIFRYPETK